MKLMAFFNNICIVFEFASSSDKQETFGALPLDVITILILKTYFSRYYLHILLIFAHSS